MVACVVIMVLVMLMVKIFFCIGRLRDAVACYERAIQLQPDTIENHKVEKINMPMYLRIL